MPSIWDALIDHAAFKDFRRSENIEDRRREKIPPGVFSDHFIDAPPNVFDGAGTMVNLNPLTDFIQVGRTPAGVALGFDDLVAVDHDPFNGTGPRWEPVEHDPFQ